VIPIAVLSPTDPGRARALLDVRAGALPDGQAAWCLEHGRNALWVGPASAAGDVATAAQGSGTGLGSLLPLAEAAGRLPEGGLARGWVNPEAVRRFLRGQAPGTNPRLTELIAAATAAELDAVRWVAFRRDIVQGRIVTDAVFVYDRAKLPAPVARVFDPGASAPPLPSSLPADVAFAAAYRIEPEACLPFLRFIAEADPRGPFRNLMFWIDEFEEYSGKSLADDLFGSLGEHAFEFVLESREGESLQWAGVYQATDPRKVEEVLVALRDWTADQAWGRSLGFSRIHPRAYVHEGVELRATTIKTLLGELPGPAFAAVGDHVVIGLGDRAVRTALDLARADTGAPGNGHGTFTVRGPALAHTLENLLDGDSIWVEAVTEFLSGVPEGTARITYEVDGIRIHGEIVLGD
jgi:hypothetical protein